MKFIGLFLMLVSAVTGLTIRVDYRFDDSGFFDNPEARVAVETAAARWSRVISQSLLPVDLQDDDLDRRLQLRHPATGNVVQASVAASPSTDRLVQANAPEANFYLDGFSLPEDVWILFVGARAIPGSGVGEASLVGPGLNFQGVGDDRDGFLVRGVDFIDVPLDLDNNFPNALTVLGGVLSFDSTASFHFDLETSANGNKTDFYSLALHEMAHCFGACASGVNEWRDLLQGVYYTGSGAQAAYENDSGLTDVLKVVGQSGGRFDAHFLDATYRSKIFLFGQPNLVGTAGVNGLQDLLMEGVTTVGGAVSRYEITNVDLAALGDMGWEVIDAELPGPEEIPTALERLDDGEVRVFFESSPGQSYFIQTSLNGKTWVNVQPPIVSEGTKTEWTDGEAGFFDPYEAASASAKKFYRVVRP